MGFSRLVLEDWSSAPSALVEARGVRFGDGAIKFLRRLEAVPSVVVVGGECDASALALLASATLGFVTDDVTVSVDVDSALALGLTSTLPAAIGGATARALLFGGPADATAVRRSGLAIDGDPEEAAARLAEPAAALLLRSLRVAAHSTRDQARQYDDELRQLR
ncbi:hypothetical protein AB0C38_45150 [Amycolatopsis sp. NPDC048633]|uniref:hypothetical protein n=1 Tax=Amycolatopsis sp. NPDC048633 TaxID=3157095 RepID=UPI0033ED63F8